MTPMMMAHFRTGWRGFAPLMMAARSSVGAVFFMRGEKISMRGPAAYKGLVELNVGTGSIRPYAHESFLKGEERAFGVQNRGKVGTAGPVAQAGESVSFAG